MLLPVHHTGHQQSHMRVKTSAQAGIFPLRIQDPLGVAVSPPHLYTSTILPNCRVRVTPEDPVANQPRLRRLGRGCLKQWLGSRGPNKSHPEVRKRASWVGTPEWPDCSAQECSGTWIPPDAMALMVPSPSGVWSSCDPWEYVGVLPLTPAIRQLQLSASQCTGRNAAAQRVHRPGPTRDAVTP